MKIYQEDVMTNLEFKRNKKNKKNKKNMRFFEGIHVQYIQGENAYSEREITKV